MSENNTPYVVKLETKKPRSLAINQLISTLSSRTNSNVFGISKNGKRDINKIYGYTPNYSFNNGYFMWRRGGLAFRIVNSVARSCWRDGIKVLRNDEEVLEKEIKILNRKGKLTKRLEQADILNRIGRYSVLFVGIPDGLDMDKPLGKSRPNRLHEVFFRAYAEDGVIITKWNADAASPRFGMPELYQLQVSNRGDKETETITKAIVVHWSRIVHLAEGSLDSDVEGISALEPIFNTLEDIVKTAGGSAEAYFRNARNRFSMQTDPKFATSFSPAEKKQLEEEATAFQNEWQDFIRAGGMDIKALNIPHASPMDTFMVMLKIVSGTTGIPMRILTGEGGGQLAGNEDKESYNQLVQDRRDMWCNEWIMGVLTILDEANMVKLTDDDEVSWEIPEVVSGKDRSFIAKETAAAMASLATALSMPALDGIIEVEDALRLVFGDDALADFKLQSGLDDGLTDEELEELARDELGIVEGDEVVEGSNPDDIQKKALNGAQIQNLVAIIKDVASGAVPIESATQTIKVAFPTLTDDEIAGILGPVAALAAANEPEPGEVIEEPVLPGEDDDENTDHEDDEEDE